MAVKDAASRLRDAAPVTPENRGTATATVSVEQSLPEGVELLDPTTSARRYWRDPQTGTQREIWRPGDGDGDVVHDHYDRRGPLAPLEQRWRFYQSPGPFKSRITEPPSNVILDDRAVYDILESNIPRAQLSKRWSHDFSGQANVRHRRPHRGRPAYKDENAVSEKDKYQFFRPTGKATPLYFFLGEKDFEPVFYQELPEQPAQSSESSDPDDAPKKPKQHNQYTAPELLVRNGAESKSLTKGKYRQRVNTFLRRSPTPPWVKDRKKLFGGVGIGRSGEDTAGNAAKFDFSFAAAPAPDLAATVPSGESMWVDQDDEDELEESEDELVMTSVFDKTPSQRPTAARVSDGEEDDADGASTAPQKRKASTALASARHKAPKQMGYIERLAAGLLEEDAETAAAAPKYPHNADVAPSSDRDRIAQLERDLQAAAAALTQKNAEIAELKSVLEGIGAQM